MTARQRLIHVLNCHGLSICSRPDELAAALQSAPGEPLPAEAFEPLVAAARLNLPIELLRIHRHPQHGPDGPQTFRRYGRRLRDQAQLPEETAIHALLTWLEALHEHLAQQQQNTGGAPGAWGRDSDPNTPPTAGGARTPLPRRLAAWLRSRATEFRENVRLAFARMRERRLLYKVFFLYTVLFAVFVTLLLGSLYGFMLGNIIGYFLELNMYLWLKICGFAFGGLSLVLGLYLFFADMRQRMEGQPPRS